MEITLANCVLRRHLEQDKVDFAQTARDSDYYLLSGLPYPIISREEEADLWYQKKASCQHAWAIVADSKCIGSTWIHSIDAQNRQGRFAIEIIDASYRGRGIGKTATREMLRIAFESLTLHRLDLRVLTINLSAIRCYKHCGFKEEGVLRDTLHINDTWYSDMWMSILENEYRTEP